MAEIIVVNVSLDHDLAGFSQYLWEQKLPHRLLRTADRQLLLVGNRQHAALVHSAFQRYQLGERPTLEVGEVPAGAHPFLLRVVQAPLTTVLTLLCVLGYLLVLGDPDGDWVSYLTFTRFDMVGQHVIFSLPRGEYWRLLTPIFLHFSLLHIVFNSLWLMDLGWRIEHSQGVLRMLGLVLSIGVASNIIQYQFAGAAIFGGMSGVIYGLLGYCWVWGLLLPHRAFGLPRGLIVIMVAWLLLCIAGFTQLVGLGAVANAAHVGGLVTGLILGAVFGAVARWGEARP